MNYSGRYPGLFGGATQGKRTDNVKPVKVPPPVLPDPDPLPVSEPTILTDGSILVSDVLAVEDLAQKLADDYTVTELKKIANDLGVEFKSGIRELTLATLIAEEQLKED